MEKGRYIHTEYHQKQISCMSSTLRRYDPSNVEKVYELALLGATEQQIALMFDVSVSTIEHWKRTEPEFFLALQRGKIEADTKVAAAFYKRAVGYDIEEERVTVFQGEPIHYKVKKHIPADVWAAAKWLALRQRGTWSEVQRAEVMHMNVNVAAIDLSGLSIEQLKAIESLGLKQLQANNNGRG